MELLLHEDQFNLLYDCRLVTNEDGRPQVEHFNVLASLLLITTWLLFQCLYLPCIKVIYIGRNRYACYQFMFFIGVMDVLSLHISALLSAILQLKDMSFCSSPRLIYVAGCVQVGLWLSESAISILLAICRCLEVFTPQKAEVVFGTINGKIMVLFCCAYGTLGALYSTPQVYSSHYMAWLLDPHAGYLNYKNFSTPPYDNFFYFTHNIFFIVAIVFLYIVFTIISCVRLKHFRKTGKLKFNNAQKRSFVQVALISLINSAGAMMCVYLLSGPTDELLSFIASYVWIFSRGAPAIFYLTINKTIRNGCKQIIRRAQLHSVAIVPADQTLAKTSLEMEKSIAVNGRQRSF